MLRDMPDVVIFEIYISQLKQCKGHPDLLISSSELRFVSLIILPDMRLLLLLLLICLSLECFSHCQMGV